MEKDHGFVPAALAWGGLTAYVLVADGILIGTDNATMSTAFRDTVRHPVRRWPIFLTWGFVTAHLFLHMKRDPISALGGLIDKNRR